jgi:uncharacterized protein YndB with AHSA1/START domain
LSTSVEQAVSREDRVLTIKRIFDAPREVVFTAWTKPDFITRWWGPNDFTLPFCEMDFRVGGDYKYCMRAPDGSDHWVWGKYREIIAPEKIAFTWHRGDKDGGNITTDSTIVDLTFLDSDGRTEFTLRQGVFETQKECDEHYGGWSECMVRLAEFIKGT